MPRSLTERQRRFVDAYVVSRNASQAAQDAGYTPPRAEKYGSELLQLPQVAAALRERGVVPPRGVHPLTQQRKKGQKRPRAGLTLYEERFALAYLACGNATQAARRAGINTRSPQVAGCKLLHRPRVAAFIEAERAASVERTRIDVDRVKREFARIAFMDIADIIEWDEAGIVVKPSAQISPDDRAAIAQLKLKSGEDGVKASVKLHSKQHALDSLAKLMGLYGKKPFVTIDHERERRALRERLMRIMDGDEEVAGEKKADEQRAAEKKKPENSGA